MASCSDRVSPGEHLLARDLHVVRFARVLLEGGHDLILRPTHLKATLASNRQLRPGRLVHCGQDKTISSGCEVAWDDTERSKRSEVWVGVLVDQADDAVASVRHRHVQELSEPQSRPDGLPRHR
jgi:hypothetical protein